MLTVCIRNDKHYGIKHVFDVYERFNGEFDQICCSLVMHLCVSKTCHNMYHTLSNNKIALTKTARTNREFKITWIV